MNALPKTPPMPTRPPRDTAAAAFTLIEAIITVVIAGIVLLTIFIGFQEALKHLARQRDLRTAVALSEDLMQEIRSKEFYRTSVNPINKRADCICVEDYHLWQRSPPETPEGVPMQNLQGFVRKVFIERIDPVNFNFNGPTTTNDTDFLRIRVVAGNMHVMVTNVSVVTGD